MNTKSDGTVAVGLFLYAVGSRKKESYVELIRWILVFSEERNAEQ